MFITVVHKDYPSVTLRAPPPLNRAGALASYSCSIFTHTGDVLFSECIRVFGKVLEPKYSCPV